MDSYERNFLINAVLIVLGYIIFFLFLQDQQRTLLWQILAWNFDGPTLGYLLVILVYLIFYIGNIFHEIDFNKTSYKVSFIFAWLSLILVGYYFYRTKIAVNPNDWGYDIILIWFPLWCLFTLVSWISFLVGAVRKS